MFKGNHQQLQMLKIKNITDNGPVTFKIDKIGLR